MPRKKQVQNQPSVRSVVRAWLREAIEGEEAISLPFLADKAVQHFGKQPELVQQYFAETFRQLVYGEAQSVVARTRSTASVSSQTDRIQLGDEIVTREVVKERARKLGSRWSNWMEHVGERHISLMKMTRDDCLKAIGERELRIASEQKRVTLLQRLAEQLEGDEAIEDRYSDEDIDRIWKEIDDDE